MEAIHLDPQWRIEKDTHSFKLVFYEERQKEKQDKPGKGGKPTGETESYIHEEPWYFPKLSMCLGKYLNESTKADESVKALNDRLNKLEKKIEEINVTFSKNKF